MKTLFLDATYKRKVELCNETLIYLKENNIKSVGLYASVQFVSKLETVKKQLSEQNVEVITSKPDRSHVKTQLLGCDVFSDSLNIKEDIDCYLYIGDGKFHPLALVYRQKEVEKNKLKEVICNDPIQKKMSLMEIDDISSILKKYKASLIKFFSSDIVGIIVTIKPGQEQFRPSLLLEKKYPNKRFYHFIDNNVSFDQLENFPFINVWINTSCPRVGFDDLERFRKGVINLNDALNAEDVLSKLFVE